MASRRQRSQFDMSQKRKRPHWVLWTVVSIVFIAISAFAVATFLVLKSQGFTQAGVNTLTIISIIVSAVIGFLGLLISFLQWHHPKQSGISGPDPASLLQMTPVSTLERSHPRSLQLVHYMSKLKETRMPLPPPTVRVIILTKKRLFMRNPL